MRQFVVLGHDAPTSSDFSLDGLASEAGRMDLLARCLNAAFLTSHGVRKHTRAHLVLDDITVSFDGATIRNLHPDERSIAALIRTALDAKEDAIGHQPAEPSPGIAVYRVGLEGTLDRVADDTSVVYLHEDGTPAGDLRPPSNPVFVLSDHRDFTDEEIEAIDARSSHRVSLSPRRLHADHAITVAHNWLDTNGFESW